jgi:Mrp family chromosome partitioning ATPase
MNHIRNLLRSIPFLLHLNDEEADFFFKAGRLASVKKGQLVDIKKINSLNIVIDGIFEIESIANRDIVYLSPGSFFGFLPFIENRKKGNVKALVDSRIFIIGEDDLYKLFLMSHKALRGYIKMIESLNFDISDSGKKYFDIKGKVVTVFSRSANSGKTMLASLLGLSLSGEKTIILDLSYNGKSVFDLFKQRMTVPLSEKDKGEKAAESLINDRIVRVNENLHLLNISFSARVKVDPSIIGPVLFILSRDYKYIIADLSDSDEDLRNKVFEQTDFVFALTNSKKEMEDVQPVLDEHLKEGQRVFYVRNNYFSSDKGPFYGGLILNRCDGFQDGADIDVLEKFIAAGNLDTYRNAVTARNRALVIQSAQHESILLSSLFLEINKAEKKFDYIYTSAYSYFSLCLFLLFDDYNLLKDNLKKFFSPEQFNKNFEITFPEKYIFKSAKLLKYAAELAGSKRAEMFQSLPLSYINSEGTQRLFSTGSLSRLMAASLVSEPLFEPVEIAGKKCTSGFPSSYVLPSHLLRTEAAEIFNISISNKEKLSFTDDRYNRFFTSYLETSEEYKLPQPEYMEQNKKLILDVSENEFKFDKISEKTMKLSQMLIARII